MRLVIALRWEGLRTGEIGYQVRCHTRTVPLPAIRSASGSHSRGPSARQRARQTGPTFQRNLLRSAAAGPAANLPY
jgi:hypothetical protein